ncbi:MAG: hypothetical protein ACO1QB_17910 [Verrucomicrobiales bacterium]
MEFLVFSGGVISIALGCWAAAPMMLQHDLEQISEDGRKQE